MPRSAAQCAIITLTSLYMLPDWNIKRNHVKNCTIDSMADQLFKNFEKSTAGGGRLWELLALLGPSISVSVSDSGTVHIFEKCFVATVGLITTPRRSSRWWELLSWSFLAELLLHPTTVSSASLVPLDGWRTVAASLRMLSAQSRGLTSPSTSSSTKCPPLPLTSNPVSTAAIGFLNFPLSFLRFLASPFATRFT